ADGSFWGMVRDLPLLEVVDAGTAPARQTMARYFEELGRRLPEGFESGSALQDARTLFNAPQGLFVLATVDHKPVGCGALQWHQGPDGAVLAEIKRMWVDPTVRGQGLGRRLLATLEGHARRGGARQVTLDTHGELREAMAVYRSAGYCAIERYNDNPYAQHFFAKVLPPTDSLQQRPTQRGDWDQIMALNNAEVPHVGPLQPDQGQWFIDHAAITVLETTGPNTGDGGSDGGERELVAMVVAMTDGCGYTSPNYGWFAARYPHFSYIDRIVVRADFAGAGIAQRLYHHVMVSATNAAKPVLCAEVNLEPPNERSLRFHQRFGFVEVGRQVDPRNHHTVTMLALSLPRTPIRNS
ncbi:MAG: GNAT family N-acetyltransferase, partial [Acidimicrobiales bacterium]